jgi:hypothetical protein
MNKFTSRVVVDGHWTRTLANSRWLLQTHCLLLCTEDTDNCLYHCFIHLKISYIYGSIYCTVYYMKVMACFMTGICNGTLIMGL